MPSSTQSLATAFYERTCRTGFDVPGFATVNLGKNLNSTGFRRLMVELKAAMAMIHESATGQSLHYQSVARFDQQISTKLHRDGGPAECFLMLGYEPSEVASELHLADYSLCAFDLGITPQEFLARHNPMFNAGAALLQPYTTRAPCFQSDAYQIVCINNSSSTHSDDRPKWQGVLHTATILTPDDTKRRVINSTMIVPSPLGTQEVITASQLQDFITTQQVRRQGYDKRHLHDDE
ncbi:hypothetical protein NA78x_000766 [Anatilimnocola sp. NA78]|uniref:hypothetical protein n=1 Tax=Anatilimnocola sp. NA78 TaxID=3415683 RepID=UPI003CE4603A